MNHSIHEIIELLHSDPAGVAAKFHIPLRTVYSWCSGSRKPASYITNMMYLIIKLERRLLNNGNEKERLASGMEGDQRRIKEISEACESTNGQT